MVQTSGYTIPDVNLPDGYVADRLTIEEAPIVMGTWKFTGCFSKEAVHHRVEHAILKHSTVAIRDREGSLVAFEIITPHGTKGIIPRSIVTVTAYVLRLVYTIVTQNRWSVTVWNLITDIVLFLPQDNCVTLYIEQVRVNEPWQSKGSFYFGSNWGFFNYQIIFIFVVNCMILGTRIFC